MRSLSRRRLTRSAHHGALGFGRSSERCEFPEGDGLRRPAQAEVAGLGRRNPALLGDELGHGEPAIASLTGSHPAAQESLDLIRTRCTRVHGVDHLLRSDLLAAADDSVAPRSPVAHRPAGTMRRGTPGRAGARRRAARGAAAAQITRLGVDPAEPVGDGERGEVPARFRGLGAGDPRGVAGDVHARQAAPAPDVHHGLERRLRVVPAIGAAQRSGRG